MATFDEIWARRYENPKYRNVYPYTEVVSFVFRNAPQKPRAETHILEIGCGTGNNLWFAAREGFSASGIDASDTAINFAKNRFASEGLKADLRVGDFTKLPFDDCKFDLAFERAALSLTTRDGAIATVSELRRVLRPDALFQFSLYSDQDSSFYRIPDDDGSVRDITVGQLQDGQIRFYSLNDVRELFREWTIERLKLIQETDMTRPERVVHSYWLGVARNGSADLKS